VKNPEHIEPPDSGLREERRQVMAELAEERRKRYAAEDALACAKTRISHLEVQLANPGRRPRWIPRMPNRKAKP
jgi:hypothetical protein